MEPRLPDAVDLSDQFTGGPRSQGDLQTCHAFAAAALLEAAQFRRTGERLRLSEAGLFTQARTRRKVVHDGGLLREDLYSALDRGAPEGDFYPELAARWKAGERRKDLLSPESAAAPRRDFSWLSVEGPGFGRFFASAVRTGVKNGAVKCSGMARRRDLIMRTLASGLPVGAGLLLDGVSDPSLADNGGAFGGPHYLVITGYTRTESGVVFSSRNSWTRSPSPRIIEEDLCALFGLSWLSP